MRTPVAAVILLRQDGAALFQHRDDNPRIPHAGLWTPPGGHLEPDEDLADCARREFAEETGYRLDAIQHLTTFVDDSATGFDPLPLTVFWSLYDGTQVITCLEGQALAFVPRAEASGYPIPPYLVDLWDLALTRAVEAGVLEPAG